MWRLGGGGVCWRSSFFARNERTSVTAATTAATGAAIKKNEVEEGKKTMTGAESKVNAAVDQMQQRAEKDESK